MAAEVCLGEAILTNDHSTIDAITTGSMWNLHEYHNEGLCIWDDVGPIPSGDTPYNYFARNPPTLTIKLLPPEENNN